MSGNKSDRSLSPATTNEESRRELIARQHRALYGSESPAFLSGERPEITIPTLATTTGRGPSPRGVDLFAPDSTVAAAGPSPVAAPTKSPSNSVSSPSPSANTTMHGLNSSASSPDGPASDSKAPASSIGPIGSRPAPPATTQAPLNKQSTTPLLSPLSYGLPPSDANPNGNESAAAATPSTQAPGPANESSPGVGLGWSGGNNVWRSKNSLGVRPSVWG